MVTRTGKALFFSLVYILTTLALAGGALAQSPCPATGWGRVLFGNGNLPSNKGWNHLVYYNGLFYIEANGPNAVSPWENAFWTYTPQVNCGYASYNRCDNGNACFNQLSWCGDTAGNSAVQAAMCLITPMDGSTLPTTISVAIGGGGTVPSGGIRPSTSPNHLLYFAIDDEVISASACDAGDCGAGTAGPITLTLAARGLRSEAGAVESAHVGGAANGSTCNQKSPNYAHVVMACTAPTLNGVTDVTQDHPPARHPASDNYFELNGSLYESMGYVDNYGFRDLWSLCLDSGCTPTGWRRIPQSLQSVPTNTYYEGLGYTTQNMVIPDPDDGVAFSFGGANASPATDNDLSVFCLTANPAVWVDATHTCGSPGYQGQWHKITAASGSVPTNETPRGDYDSVNHIPVWFGGCNASNCSATGIFYHVAFIYLPHSGNWCLSDTGQGGTNGTSCPQPFLNPPANRYPSSGPPPAMRFAAFTYDDNPNIDQFLYLTNENPGQLWLYDAGANVFTPLPGLTGPNYSSGAYLSGQSLKHGGDLSVWMSEGNGSSYAAQLWQLPDAAVIASLP